MACAELEIDTSLQIIPVMDEEYLTGLAEPWNALAGDVPFRGFDWAQSWWRHYQDHAKGLFTLLAIDEHGDLVGIAPWYVTASPRHGRVVRFLGSGEVCSDYLTILAHPHWAGAVAERMADWLAREGSQSWSLLDLDGVEQCDPMITCLAHRLAAHGHRIERRTEMSCWRAPLAPTWDEYLTCLSKSRRARTRALLKSAFDSGRAVVHTVADANDFERAFAILIELHQKRRQSIAEAGCFASHRFTQFHREIAGQFLATGRLRLSWIELDGRPLTAEYSFTGGKTVFYYLGGFEPEMAGEQPGWLSLAASLKRAIEEGYRSFDFLRGDEPYKASWRAQARPLMRLRVAGAQPSDRLRFATSRACEHVKDWARNLFSRTKG